VLALLGFLAVAATAAGLTISMMVLRSNGDAWQLFAVLLILALLGEMLTPILQRFLTTPMRELLPDREVSVADDEQIVVRHA